MEIFCSSSDFITSLHTEANKSLSEAEITLPFFVDTILEIQVEPISLMLIRYLDTRL